MEGFTLVEIALSVGFIAILSVTMVLLVNDTIATYRRGLTLNSVTTTGSDLVDELKSTIKNSPVGKVTRECEALYNPLHLSNYMSESQNKCEKDEAQNLVVLQRYADVYLTDEEKINIPVYGAICTGAYSYIWNSGYFFGENRAGATQTNATEANEQGKIRNLEPAKLIYTPTSTGVGYATGHTTVEGFRLLKVRDDRRAVCKSANKSEDGSSYNDYQSRDSVHQNLTNVFDISNPDDGETNANKITYFKNGLEDEGVVILYADDETNPLALYDLTITPPASDSSDRTAFYTGSFILGTLQGGINVKATGNFCKTPEDYDENFDYCAINKFNFAAQATGG